MVEPVWLLDVNILVALLWRPHSHHRVAQSWFDSRRRRRWASCPITQAGFVRIIGNPQAQAAGVSPRDALRALEESVARSHHEFWADDLPLAEALAPVAERLRGHRQITDAYLLGLTLRRGGRLATFDRGVLALLPEGHPARKHVDLIQ